MIRVVVLASVLATACAVDEPTVAEVSQQAAVCADGPTTFGIDVSRFQGDINWALVKGAGVKFAWIQISRSLTDIDVKFPYNWQQAKANGINSTLSATGSEDIAVLLRGVTRSEINSVVLREQVRLDD